MKDHNIVRNRKCKTFPARTATNTFPVTEVPFFSIQKILGLLSCGGPSTAGFDVFYNI